MKLTTAMKDRIVESIMKDTFTSREQSILSEKTSLGEAIYADFYGQYKTKMMALPECMFLQKSTFSIKIEGDRFTYDLPVSSTRRFGKCHDYGNMYIAKDHPFAAAYRDIERKENVLVSDKTALRQTLKSTIYPVTTDKRLVEIWPDAEKYIPRTPAAMANLPAVRCDELNEMIGRMRGDA